MAVSPVSLTDICGICLFGYQDAMGPTRPSVKPGQANSIEAPTGAVPRPTGTS